MEPMLSASALLLPSWILPECSLCLFSFEKESYSAAQIGLELMTFNLLSAGITGVHHHAQLINVLL
jgi:hypothetical protein